MNQRIGYVAVIVRDYDEAKAWYCNILGFVLVEDTPLSEAKRWLVVTPAGGSGTSLLLAKAATKEQKEAIGKQTGGRVFLFLHTDDFWRDYRAMRQRASISAKNLDRRATEQSQSSWISTATGGT